MTSPAPPEPTPDEPHQPPSIDEEPSITGMHGSIARFEMSYDPSRGEPAEFGPPMRQLLPAYCYAALALAFAAVVGAGYAMGPLSRLGVWVLEGDRDRPFPAFMLAGVLIVSGLATVWRSRMRGVVVHGEGLEARYLLALGIPKVRKWTWAQIDRFIVDDAGVMVQLWNGDYERLPAVAAQNKLNGALVAVATARKKELTVLEPRG